MTVLPRTFAKESIIVFETWLGLIAAFDSFDFYSGRRYVYDQINLFFGILPLRHGIIDTPEMASSLNLKGTARYIKFERKNLEKLTQSQRQTRIVRTRNPQKHNRTEPPIGYLGLLDPLVSRSRLQYFFRVQVSLPIVTGSNHPSYQYAIFIKDNMKLNEAQIQIEEEMSYFSFDGLVKYFVNDQSELTAGETMFF